MSDDNRLGRATDALRGPLDRRAALAVGGAATASAALIIAGCSSASASSGSSASGSGSGGSATLGPASEVPVGGGTVYDAQKVVVTQPTAGNFKAFSAICTHMGCTVNSVSGGTINCPCHGSKFKITDGSVAHGPATMPLPSQPVSDVGGTLKLT